MRMLSEKINMIKSAKLKDNIVKVIQLSDTHLFADDDADIFGAKSNIKFKEVVEKILDEDSHDADIIFLTGDVSQDETDQSYQKVIDIFSKLTIPVYWIPGNHDNFERMKVVFKDAKNFFQARHLTLPGWNLIFLNTKDGYLPDSELALLKNTIATLAGDANIAIVMHHHPAEVGTPLVDHYILQNRNEFWDIITGTQVKLIICGHVHGDYKFKYRDVMIESTPATCLQWQQGTKDLKIDSKIGFKIYYFTPADYTAIAKLW
ncbi:MAG: hypothetical protein EPO11_08555 [Gammaproteobacteria bacterium]|nr:MAG: hypothetical protein EPO11_08555 [Gammaproteobacteria bacterium]